MRHLCHFAVQESPSRSVSINSVSHGSIHVWIVLNMFYLQMVSRTCSSDLNSGLAPSEANNKAPRPEIHSYSAAEAPGPLCLALPATPPPPGASPPPRGCWERPSATGSGLGQPMPQRRVHCLLQEIRCRFELDWPKSSKVYISESSYIILFVNILSEQGNLVKGTPSLEKIQICWIRCEATWHTMQNGST